MALTVESKISALLDDERGKAVLERHCPELLTDPRIKLAMGMTLAQIIPFSGGRITQQTIEAISQDLAQL